MRSFFTPFSTATVRSSHFSSRLKTSLNVLCSLLNRRSKQGGVFQAQKPEVKLQIQCQILSLAITDDQTAQWMPPPISTFTQTPTWDASKFPTERDILRKSGC
jgi:hypothetical protein